MAVAKTAYTNVRVRSRRQNATANFLVPSLSLGGLFWALTGDWIAFAGVLCLWGFWFALRKYDNPPVIRMALSFHWLQITCGIYYFALTGREVEAMWASDYRPMVLLGLGCLTSLALGLYSGIRFFDSRLALTDLKRSHAFTWNVILWVWFVSIFVQAVLRELAWTTPGLTQGVLAISYTRLGIVFLVLRRVVQPTPRWGWFCGVLAVELLLGFTGYFAGFREPLVLAVLAFIEAFDYRSPTHWVRLGWIGAVGLVAGVLWMGIRTTYRAQYDEHNASRAERLETIGGLSSQWLNRETSALWEDADRLVERVWAIYYPAIAVSRVPEALPHTDGALMSAALRHIVTPRLFFPNKGILPSDSELVRKYTGIFVAGAEQNTSIAFGYAAEAYVDFGVPVMFLPSLVFGIFMGASYVAISRQLVHRELSIAALCVIFWMSLFLFERSWVKTLGLAGTLIIYVGGTVWLLDHWLRRSRSRQRGRSSDAARHRKRRQIGSSSRARS